jgi:hypothetical protein
MQSSTLSRDSARLRAWGIPFTNDQQLLIRIQVLRFFRFRDYATVVTATAFSVPVGYIFGEPPHRCPSPPHIFQMNSPI